MGWSQTSVPTRCMASQISKVSRVEIIKLVGWSQTPISMRRLLDQPEIVKGVDLVTDFRTDGSRKSKFRRTHGGARRASPQLSDVESLDMAAVFFRCAAAIMF